MIPPIRMRLRPIECDPVVLAAAYLDAANFFTSRSFGFIFLEQLQTFRQFARTDRPPGINFFPSALIHQLRALSRDCALSLRHGDLLLLNQGWYVTHAGLLRLAKRRHCAGIHV
jgi:hypothetical protein